MGCLWLTIFNLTTENNHPRLFFLAFTLYSGFDDFNSNLNLVKVVVVVFVVVLLIQCPYLRHRIEWHSEAEPWLVVFLQGPWLETGLLVVIVIARVGIQYSSFYPELLTLLQASLHHHIN